MKIVTVIFGLLGGLSADVGLVFVFGIAVERAAI
jgi:hypothetical protein